MPINSPYTANTSVVNEAFLDPPFYFVASEVISANGSFSVLNIDPQCRSRWRVTVATATGIK